MQKKSFKIGQNISLTKYLTLQGFKTLYVKNLLHNKDIKVNGKRIGQNVNLVAGDLVECYFDDKQLVSNNQDVEMQNKIEVIYQDDKILIVNKIKGLATCGQNSLETIFNAHAVHRLDTNTSGLTILAKNLTIKQEFVDEFRADNIVKKYLCQVIGKTNFKNEIKKAFLFKDAKKSKVYIYDEFVKGSVPIATKFNTLKNGELSSIVECELLTGKTHQIRAHLSHLGHHIVGDNKYGKKENNKIFKAKTQRLECYFLFFRQLSGDNIKYLSNKHFQINNSKIKENLL